MQLPLLADSLRNTQARRPKALIALGGGLVLLFLLFALSRAPAESGTEAPFPVPPAESTAAPQPEPPVQPSETTGAPEPAEPETTVPAVPDPTPTPQPEQPDSLPDPDPDSDVPGSPEPEGGDDPLHLVGTIPKEYCVNAWKVFNRIPLENRGKKVEPDMQSCAALSRYATQEGGGDEAGGSRAIRELYPESRWGAVKTWFLITKGEKEGRATSRVVKCTNDSHRPARTEICAMHLVNTRKPTDTNSKKNKKQTQIAPLLHDAWTCVYDYGGGRMEVSCIEMEYVEEGTTNPLEDLMKLYADTKGTPEGDMALAAAVKLQHKAIGLLADAIDRGVIMNTPHKTPQVAEVRASDGRDAVTHTVLFDWWSSSMFNTTVPGFLRHIQLARGVNNWKMGLQMNKDMAPLHADITDQLRLIATLNTQHPDAFTRRAGWPTPQSLTLDEKAHGGVSEAIKMELGYVIRRTDTSAASVIERFIVEVLPVSGVILHTLDAVEIRLTASGDGEAKQLTAISWRAEGRGYRYAQSASEAEAVIKTLKETEHQLVDFAFRWAMPSVWNFIKECVYGDKPTAQIRKESTKNVIDATETYTYTYTTK
eukprot:GDKI01046626.1.p1 GENE.GDKI01046626.1~~GDKI01046626.1.p1  ORF type:complete len:594 (-),score=133.17 GDKI01046626.1:154-1935(-)